MEKEALKEHLKALVEINAPSGMETPVADYLREAWADLVDEFETDGIGSLIGIKRGTGAEPRKRIMLSAHMDEIANIVVEVRDGYLRLEDIWGTDYRINLAKPVLVHTSTRVLKGVVAAVPPHISNQTGERNNYTPRNQQWIDLGLPAEDVEVLVNVGDFVTIDAPMLELMGGKVAGKAMDDRASVAAVTACLHYLQNRLHTWDVYATASAQEETGLKGAKTAAFHIAPDLAIAIDVNIAEQSGVSGDEYPKLGDGPCLGLGPNFHPGLYKGLQDAAKRIEMSVPIDAMPGGSGTDAWAIQISRAGVPTALLSLALRNMHSPIETLSLKDVDRTGRLMAEFISGLAEDYLDTIQWKIDDDDSANGEDDE